MTQAMLKHLAALSLLVPGVAAAGVFALSDRLPVYPEGEIARLERASPPKQRGGAAAPASTAEALANVRKSLARVTTPANERALAAIAAQADARSMQLAAAELVFARRTAAAVALLLRAHEKAPGDALVLLNLANTLASAGFGQESLKLIEELERRAKAAGNPSPTSRAMLLATRGYALLTLNQNAAAEQALRAALALDAGIAEPARNLAWLLVKQGRREEAAKMLVAAGRPGGAAAAAGGAAAAAKPAIALTNNPAQLDIASLMRRAQGAARPARKPLAQAYDLSRGHAIAFPEVPAVAPGAQTYAPLQQFVSRTQRYQADVAARNQRRQQLEDDVERRRLSGEISPLTDALAREIFMRIDSHLVWHGMGEAGANDRLHDLEVVPYGSRLREASNRGGEEDNRVLEEFSNRIAKAATDMVAAKSCAPMAQLHSWSIGQRNPSIGELERALRNYWAFVAPRITALVGNLRDPAYHELARIAVDNALDELEIGLWSARGPTYTSAGFGAECAKMQRAAAQAQAAEAASRVKAARCAGLPGRDFAIELALLQVRGNCEQVKITLGLDYKRVGEFLMGREMAKQGIQGEMKLPELGSGIFTELEWNADGSYTLYTGAKYELAGSLGTTTGVDAGARGGVFVSGNSEGIQDMGLRGETSAKGAIGGTAGETGAQFDGFTLSGFRSGAADIVMLMGLY